MTHGSVGEKKCNGIDTDSTTLQVEKLTCAYRDHPMDGSSMPLPCP